MALEMTVGAPGQPSSLTTDRWHPAFLLEVRKEYKPADWQGFDRDPYQLLYYCVVWNEEAQILTTKPEYHHALSGSKLTAKGQFQASNAYKYVCQILQRQLAPHDRIVLPPCPIPLRLKTVLNDKGFVRVVDLEAWPDGQQYLAPLKDALAQAIQEQEAKPMTFPPKEAHAHLLPGNGHPAPAPSAPSAPAAVPDPSMQRIWGAPPAAAVAAPPAPTPPSSPITF